MKGLRICLGLLILFSLGSCSNDDFEPYIPSEWKYDQYADVNILPGDDFYRYVCGKGITAEGSDVWAPIPQWKKQESDYIKLAFSVDNSNPVPVLRRINELRVAYASPQPHLEDAFALMRQRLADIGDLKDIKEYPGKLAQYCCNGYNLLYVQSKVLEGHKFGIGVTAVYEGMIQDWPEEQLRETGIYYEYRNRLPKAREFEQYLIDNIKDGGVSINRLDANNPEECRQINEYIANTLSPTKASVNAFGRFAEALGNANPDFVPTDANTRQYFELLDKTGNDMLEAANAFLWCMAVSYDLDMMFHPDTLINFFLAIMYPSLIINMSHTFCDRYASQEAIRKNREIFEDLRNTMSERVAQSGWMTQQAKAQAQEKLEAMQCHTGMLDWSEYEADMPVSADFCTALHEIGSDYISKLMKHSGEYDNLEHIIATEYMMPMAGYPAFTANSFYLRSCNAMCILPSTALLMDMNPEFPFTTYIVAHELCHGFDADGASFNARGEYGDWWTTEDQMEFKKIQNQVMEIFNGYSIGEGIFCDGAKTTNEDMADLGGMEIAYYATSKRLEEESGGEELMEMKRRFFKSYAIFYAQYSSMEDKINAIRNDVHSINEYRVNGILNNISDWYPAFDITPGQKFYLPPERRVTIW